MQRLVQLDLHDLEKFELRYSGWNFVEHLDPICTLIGNATWPALKALDLRHYLLNDGHILLLTAGVWPLLQSLTICGSSMTIRGMKQLVHGNWPLLTTICSPQLQGRGAVDLKPLFTKWPSLVLLVDTVGYKN